MLMKTHHRSPCVAPFLEEHYEPVAAPAMALYEQLSATKKELESIVARLLQLKVEASQRQDDKRMNDDLVSELQELSTQAAVALMNMRRLNREILTREDQVKQETEAARAPVETISLRLHNLQYEVDHYLRSIAASESFTSRWPEIDMVSTHEFFMDAPESLKSEEGLEKNPHRLEIMRLNYELHQVTHLHKDFLHQRSFRRTSAATLCQNHPGFRHLHHAMEHTGSCISVHQRTQKHECNRNQCRAL